MKITSIDVVKVNTGVSKRVEGIPWNIVCVMVHTDEGLTGYGEVGLAYGNAGEAAAAMSVDFAKPVLGMNPLNTEEIWEKLFRTTFWGMGGGTVVYGAMSAIDMALWDIKGKALNVPCYVLLGGKTNERLRAYASQLQFGWGEQDGIMVTPQDYFDITKLALKDGYDAVKVDPIGFDEKGVWMNWKMRGNLTQRQIRIASERVRAMREAGGPDMDIIIELHSLTDATTAVQLGREMEQYNCMYLEEATMPLNPKMMREIYEKVKIPIATGERIYTRWGYRPFFEERSIDMIQPDLGLVGGISEGKKICEFANIYDIGVQAHVCGGPIATAAALHLEAAIPNFVIHEQHASTMLPYNIATCKYNYQTKDGHHTIPELPGLGQELSEETVKRSEIVTVK